MTDERLDSDLHPTPADPAAEPPDSAAVGTRSATDDAATAPAGDGEAEESRDEGAADGGAEAAKPEADAAAGPVGEDTAEDTAPTTAADGEPVTEQTAVAAVAGETAEAGAGEAAAEAPRPGETKSEQEAKPEEPKAEEAKPEEPKAEEAKPEEPKAEEPKAGEPKAGEPKAEESKAEEPKSEEDRPGEPKAEEDEPGEPRAEEGKAEEDKAEEPKAEEPEDPALAELRRSREAGTPVEGRVIGWNRGGFHVVVSGLTAFCPSSEMEVGRPKSPASYVEQTFPFKVIKVQKKGRRVVLSRAAILGEQRQDVIGRLSPGTVAKGRVTSLPDFGAFVDLGGVEGLVHVSEISRSRVQHPKDALELGQEVEVKVLKVEQGGERISLSIKDLEPDPWRGANERFGRGDRFSGKVLRRTDFGLFVELEPEVEGLLHVSQLPPGKSFDDEAYQPGQTIEGWVREIEPKRQRISLSLREVPTDDPWKQIGERFPEGESVEGVVESVAPFGVFIFLAPGVTGLLPNSQTGLPRGSNAARAFSPGQTVRVQVVSIDQRRKRISLGREGAHVEASKNDLQDFKRREKERVQEAPTAMAAAFARLRGEREDD